MANKFEKPLLVMQSFLPPFESYAEQLKKIWDTHWLTNQGPLHIEFEKDLKERLKSCNITLFTNGHLALDSAIKALDLRGEVITTPFTFVSTTNAIVLNNLTPVFCDIKMSDYTIDEEKIENLITEKTSAIIPVHVYGYPCNVNKIQKIADKYNLKVIYDAAHAFSEKVDGTPIGNFGDISMFSFHATKVFNTIEGGALTYKNEYLKHRLDLMKNFGISGPEQVSLIGLNAKMNEFQAAMGIVNLKFLDENIRNRHAVTNVYYNRLSSINGIKIYKTPENVEYNYSYMPILINEKEFGVTRDQLFDKLTEYNVYARKYFYPLIINTDAYSKYNADVPNAEYVSNRILCIPIFSEMTVSQAEQVCDIIKEIYTIDKKRGI